MYAVKLTMLQKGYAALEKYSRSNISFNVMIIMSSALNPSVIYGLKLKEKSMWIANCK